MPLGTEVGLGQATLCKIGTQLLPRKGAQQSSPLFGSLCSDTVAHLSKCCALVEVHNVKSRQLFLLTQNYRIGKWKLIFADRYRLPQFTFSHVKLQ